LSLRCELEVVRADPQMLGIVLRNLVGNALRYCPAGSRVEIEAARAAGRERIAVRDDGPGVDAASRRRLTERFFRVLGQEEGGSGLGLSIVQRIADLHGIALAFGTGLEGRGLEVSLAWPLAS
jgi:two-component system sensor histidine kinase QseC